MKPRRYFHLGAVLVMLLGLMATAVLADSRGLSVNLSGAGGTQSVQLYDNSYALVIGIDKYTGGWPRLHKAVEDAEAVAQALKDMGFDVTLKKDLDAEALRTTLRTFFAIKGADPQARLFLWYAGHGHTIGDMGFLVPADAPVPSDLQFKVKALPMTDFGGLVRLAEAKHVLSVFDSCFSGTIFRTRGSVDPSAMISAKTAKPVRQFLTSGDAGQQVRDDGSFRKLFVRALGGEARADANGDGYLTGEELGLYMSQEISGLTNAAQTPKFGALQDVNYMEGDFVFKLEVEVRIPRPPSQDTAESERLRVENERLRAQIAASQSSQQVAVVSPPVRPAAGGSRSPGSVFRDCADCPEMVVVPAGSFDMGSNDGDSDEKPIHRVTIPRSFAVGKYEVTQAEWESVMRSNPSKFKGSGNPVEQVSWDHAQEFIRRLNGKVGGVATASSGGSGPYRLLTEAEWEYAARAGTTTPWSCGSSEGCLGGVAWYKGNANKQTHAVGSKSANGFGLYDMHGNVFEWVADCYQDSYQGAPTNGSAVTTGDCSMRVLRGGSWVSFPGYLRSAFRLRGSPVGRNVSGGFRLARTVLP